MTNRRPAARGRIPISPIEAVDDKDRRCGRAMLPARITGFFRVPARRAPSKGDISNFRRPAEDQEKGEDDRGFNDEGFRFSFWNVGLDDATEDRRSRRPSAAGEESADEGSRHNYDENDGQQQRLARDESAIRRVKAAGSVTNGRSEIPGNRLRSVTSEVISSLNGCGETDDESR